MHQKSGLISTMCFGKLTIISQVMRCRTHHYTGSNQHIFWRS